MPKPSDPRLWILVGFILHTITALTNIGFIALDDYLSGIALYLPAQLHSAADIITASPIRSPIPNLLLFGVAKLAHAVGFEHPISQLRIVNLFVMLFGQLGIGFAVAHFRLLGADRSKLAIAAFLCELYFLSPLFLTRPLVESLSIPWLTMSAYFLSAYLVDERPSRVVWSVLALGMACVFRFQDGVCALPLFAFVLVRRRRADLLALFATAAVVVVGTGLVDLIYKGGLHASLYEYLALHVRDAHAYFHAPFYVFTLLIFALTLPPTLVSRYRGLAWRREYAALLGPLSYFVVFLIAHSLIPLKEERFMVPVLLLLLVLLTPLCHHLLHSPTIAPRHRALRLYSFVGLNTLGLALASFNAPQSNTIGLVRFVDAHPEIRAVHRVERSSMTCPWALTARRDFGHDADIPETRLRAEDCVLEDCAALLVVDSAQHRKLGDVLVRYRLVREFRPGPLEQLLVTLNPRGNARRGTIYAYTCPNCPPVTAGATGRGSRRLR